MLSKNEIHNKIISVKNTQKITKAMEMIAASKMRKAKERMETSLPYSEAIRKVIYHLTIGNLEYRHPYFKERNIKKVGYIIVSTDRGLAGGLNINLFKKVLIDIEKWNKKKVQVELALIGAKAVSFFNILKTKIVAQVTGIGDNPAISNIIGLIKVMLQAYDESNLDIIYIVSNKFINTMSQHPKILQILPLSSKKKDIIDKKIWDYIYEPEPEILLNTLLRRYIESQVYQNIVENLASEQAARMVAMKIATDNGSDLIKELELIYNKTRQTNITKEITEIISETLTF